MAQGFSAAEIAVEKVLVDLKLWDMAPTPRGSPWAKASSQFISPNPTWRVEFGIRSHSAALGAVYALKLYRKLKLRPAI